MDDIEQLRAENTQLRQMARMDSLTGLLNRSVFQQEVNLALKQRAAGTLLMIDLDDFKGVNDQYGHFIGDLVLQALANILSSDFFPKDLVGRMGGDEFAVFFWNEHRFSGLEELIGNALDRFVESGAALGLDRALSFSVGAATFTAGQSFESLYQCADSALLNGKRKSPGAISYYTANQTIPMPTREKEKTKPAFSTDIQHIRQQLRESEPNEGAYCPDYQKFMAVYHFLERGLCRTPQSIPLILISLTDEAGDFPQLEHRAYLTKRLADNLQSSLRTSDIFTQYSSAQFLVMAPGADGDNITLIQNRIQKTMAAALPERKDIHLHFSFYPLQPILKQGAASQN